MWHIKPCGGYCIVAEGRARSGRSGYLPAKESPNLDRCPVQESVYTPEAGRSWENQRAVRTEGKTAIDLEMAMNHIGPILNSRHHDRSP